MLLSIKRIVMFHRSCSGVALVNSFQFQDSDLAIYWFRVLTLRTLYNGQQAWTWDVTEQSYRYVNRYVEAVRKKQKYCAHGDYHFASVISQCVEQRPTIPPDKRVPKQPFAPC